VDLGTNPLLNQLTSFVNVLLSGVGLPEEVREVIYSGSLTALEKQGGELRPITVGYRTQSTSLLDCKNMRKICAGPCRQPVGTPSIRFRSSTGG